MKILTWAWWRKMANSKRYSFDKEQKEFLDHKLDRIPKHWREKALDKFTSIMRKKGVRAANDYINELIAPLENLLNIAVDDDAIKELSKALAFKVREWGGDYNNSFYTLANELCMAYAVRYPIEFDPNQQRARLTCDLWWLRNLRNSHARAREVAAINAGLVHRKASLYCSDDTMERRGEQIRRNASLLNEVILRSESGQQMTLADISKAGVSNPENRRAELITRVTGFEQLANEYGHKAVFITVTCPSRMHAVNSNGKNNPKYDGTKPDEAQRYLVECWARARAKLARLGVKYYGLRVAEPHHDATPHWHMILFFQEKDKNHLVDAINFHFLADSWFEEGAQENRVKFMHINPLKGTAAGYVMKYVCKNIDGIDEQHIDEIDGKKYEVGKNLHGRVEAWASTWKIRQFQQLGGHSVTVWRELRRVAAEVCEKAGAVILQGWQSVQKRADHKANFAEFITAMGGLNRSPKKSLIQIDDDYITRRGRYGETVARVINGVRERFGIMKAENNRENWERV